MPCLPDKCFFQQLLKLATPIVIQNLLMSSLSAVDVIMIGQLGETQVAAVGLADQLYFLLTLILFGINSGAAILTAQYWGKKDTTHLHQALGLCLGISIGLSAIFSLLAIGMPQVVLQIYSHDPIVIDLGTQYLAIMGWCYVITAITFSYATVLRSIEQVKVTLAINLIALTTNTGLNYLLIFGHAGFPALGVQGAAIATCIARYLECFLLLSYVYTRACPLAAPLANLYTIKKWFVTKFLRLTLPIVMAEVVWAVGITVYNLIFAHISTDSIAAINIAMAIEKVSFVIFLGLGSAGGIMIGNRIGANEIQKAKDYALYFIALNPTMAIFMGLIILSNRVPLLNLYHISPTATDYVYYVLTIMSLVLPFKMANFTMFVAILRSGGDTRFVCILESCTIWGIGVPLAIIGAFIWQLPVHWVYLMVMLEELIKCPIGLYRLRSGKWVNNLAQQH